MMNSSRLLKHENKYKLFYVFYCFKISQDNFYVLFINFLIFYHFFASVTGDLHPVFVVAE